MLRQAQRKLREVIPCPHGGLLKKRVRTKKARLKTVFFNLRLKWSLMVPEWASTLALNQQAGLDRPPGMVKGPRHTEPTLHG